MKRFNKKSVFRLVIACVVGLAVVSLTFLREILPKAGSTVSRTISAVGGIVFFATLFRYILITRGKKETDFELLNSQFSTVMRQLNTISRYIPKMTGKIADDITASAQKGSLRDIYRETKAFNTADLAHRYPQFMREIDAYIEESVTAIDSCADDAQHTLAMLGKLYNRNEDILHNATKQRVEFLELFEKRRK